MLCIQKDWPCLLVGISGSGKTTLIHKLANSIGAEIVDVSLSSEMDTMDLVGGYEQLDPGRQVVSLIKTLQKFNRNVIIQQLETRHQIDQDIANLEAKLRAPVARPADLLQMIRLIAEANPQSGYSGFLDDCESLMQQATTDNRARFEWVDGVLVKALQQGKWLILDNANLCSPSILDRLNSLLEPNGFLSIDEHRTPDGSARIVKPHPNFKLFMTMDPRHGELSRAMRNRSVELFLPIDSPSPKLDMLNSCGVSTLSRFESFQVFDWGSFEDAHFVETLANWFENLTFQDLNLCHRWQKQVAQGLYDLPPQKQIYISAFVRIFQQMLEFNGITLSGIRSTYENISKNIGSAYDIGRMQVSVWMGLK